MQTDLLKPTQDDQMAEMMLLMQMDKLSPEFVSGNFSGESQPPPLLYPNTGFFRSPENDENYVFSPENSSSNKQNSMAAMREMIFRIAAMQPIYIDPESVKPPKRRNVKISKDPQSVAARHRRERISERIRILQRLVPGGTKMDTASMLDEAIHYVKFLKTQVQNLERAAVNRPPAPVHTGVGFPVVAGNEGGYFPVMKGYHVMHNGEGSQG